jgi:hypothetical protein
MMSLYVYIFKIKLIYDVLNRYVITLYIIKYTHAELNVKLEFANNLHNYLADILI